MRKKRFLNILFLLGIIVFSLSFLATSCKEESDNNPTQTPTHQNKLYGKWVTDHWQTYNDTIFFDSDYYVKNYFEGSEIGYDISNDTIYFNFPTINYPCRFTLSGDTLTIFEFGYILSQYPMSHHNLMFTKIK